MIGDIQSVLVAEETLLISLWGDDGAEGTCGLCDISSAQPPIGLLTVKVWGAHSSQQRVHQERKNGKMASQMGSRK